MNNNHSVHQVSLCGQSRRTLCTKTESVKAAEMGECNMNAVAHVTLNPQKNTWPEGKHHFDASQAIRVLY